MLFFERLFSRSQKQQEEQIQIIPQKNEKQREKLQIELTNIIEENNKFYFEITKGFETIPVEQIQNLYDEVAQNLDIAPIIRQGLSIEVDTDKQVLRVAINTDNFSHIEGFKNEAKKILEKIKRKIEKEI